MDSNNLSDGEIQDSDQQEGPVEQLDGDDASPPVAKKIKTIPELDYSEPGLYGGSSGKSKKEKKKGRKEAVSKLTQAKNKQLAEFRKLSEESLDLTAVNALHCLVSLDKGDSLASDVVKLKTANFRSLVSHLVCGEPGTTTPVNGSEALREKRVVVAWLSNLSCHLFSQSSNFTKLKSISPCVKFNIEHPGSTRFVKLGLEAFFCSPSSEGTPSKTKSPTQKISTRSSYLLSKHELIDNEYPVPSQGIVDISDYCSIASWPEVDQKSLVKDMCKAPMFAIDCEMVGTKLGSELARVSIVNEALECLYDSLVKPDNPVLDYRTQFSGIAESDLRDVTVTLKDVHEKLAEILPKDSILIGHSLESDFRALQFYHPYVIDTSLIFTPYATATYKPSLKRLSSELLKRQIQDGSKGHNSIEDASTCMQLVQLKLSSGPGLTIPFNESTPSIVTDVRAAGKSSGMVDRAGVVRKFGRGASIASEVEGDKNCIDKALEIIPQCDFTFLQLHDLELHYKGNKSFESEQDVMTAMDSNVLSLIERCPKDTLLFVVCGSCDIRKVKRLQKDEFADPVDLKEACMMARTGHVLSFIVN